MKKVIAFIVLGSCIILFCIFHFSVREIPSLGPICNVMDKCYYTNDPRYYENMVPDNYESYGVITTFVDRYDHDHEKDLSTNYDQYLNKEVYVDKSNDKYIYLKYSENEYLKLHFEEESENEVE